MFWRLPSETLDREPEFRRPNWRFAYRILNGEPMVVSTNNDWKSSDQAAEGWQGKTFNDSNWVTAQQLGPYGSGPWGEMRSEFRRLPARMLRREFVLEKKIKRATAYVPGWGFMTST